MKIAWLTVHRAAKEQLFRRKELAGWIENIRAVMRVNPGILYRIYVAEQVDEKGWNRGLLYNAAFQTAAVDDRSVLFIHCNTDYRLPLESLPDELFYHEEGFLELHGYPEGLGSFCAFYASAFEQCNGFPSDLRGWGGEDVSIKKRIDLTGLLIHRPDNLYNKWLKENSDHPRDQSANQDNIAKGTAITAETLWDNGLSRMAYKVESVKEYGDTVWARILT
jgi:hypothetical protein